MNTKENIDEVMISWYNKIGNGIIIGLFGEILKKYKELNRGFYVKVNKVKKVYAEVQ